MNVLQLRALLCQMMFVGVGTLVLWDIHPGLAVVYLLIVNVLAVTTFMEP